MRKNQKYTQKEMYSAIECCHREDIPYSLYCNLAENAIRPITLGRKNYLFTGSDRGAEGAAMFYSFFGTCKANNVNPLQWLKRVLEIIPEHKVNRLHELLPQNL